MRQKVVARFNDGRAVKGFTEDFSPARPGFTIAVSLDDGKEETVEIRLADLKAVFFVQTLEGNNSYKERKLQIPEGRIGKRLLVTFSDGECLRGTAVSTSLSNHGFMLFPSDPGSNNNRIFVVKSAIRQTREE